MKNYKKNSQLSVCILAPEMPPVVGGAETFSEVLALSLLRKSVKVYIVTSKNPRAYVREAVEKNGGQVFVTEDVFTTKDGFVAWEWAMFSRSQILHDIITNYHIDIIHALSHDTIISSSIAICNLNEDEKIPLVITTSEMSTEDSEFGMARYKFTYQLPIDGLLQLSQYYVDVVMKYGCKPKVKKIASCVDVELFSTGNRMKGREKLNISEHKFLITCPSRFSRRKGQNELLEAIELLPENFQEKIVCLLAGSTNSASNGYYTSLISKAEKIKFDCLIQSVMREDMPDIFSATDLVVMPSYKEGLGFAAIESMVAGCPVLLYNTTGFDEIPDEEGQVEFCEVGNIKMLAEKIQFLMKNVIARKQLAQNGQKLAKEKFSTEEFTKKVISFYDEVLLCSSKK